MEPDKDDICMDASVGGVTVNAAPLDVIPSRLAVIVEDPAATPVATPVGSMAAAPMFDDVHVTNDEILCVVWSLKVPVALKKRVLPAGIDAAVGETEIDTSTAELTVNVTAGDEILP